MMRIRYTLVESRISFDQLHILIQKSNPRICKEVGLPANRGHVVELPSG